MVTAKEIGWGSYRQYEGPFYRGKCSYVLPASPTEEEKIMAVITATEGGHYDAWNGYDVCGWTSGLIQWCERGQYSVSDMLGAVDLSDSNALDALRAYGEQFGVRFGRSNLEGKFAHRFFFFRDGEGVVDTQAEQQRLFYQHGDGTKGSWSDATKNYAKGWAAVISSVWESPAAQAVQVDYTVKRLGGFMLGSAKRLFASAPDTPVAAAARAAYLSFAANNPSWADKSLAVASRTSHAVWSLEWFIALLKAMTFSPKIAIYPARYNAIRPVLERIYKVELPDFAAELEHWVESTGMPATIDTKKLQYALKSLGYDLGPAGVDGVYGKKTREAVLTLEQLSGIVPEENQDGLVDVYTWPALQNALKSKGLPELT